MSKLTSLGIVFRPINVLAGIGGMSEFTMMSQDAGVTWPVAYSAFAAAAAVGWGTYQVLEYVEVRRVSRVRARKQG